MTRDWQESKRTVAALEARAAVLRNGAPSRAELGLLLTDCAAEAMALRVEVLRARRMLGALLEEPSDRDSDRVRTLTDRIEDVESLREELAVLTGELRGRLPVAAVD